MGVFRGVRLCAESNPWRFAIARQTCLQTAQYTLVFPVRSPRNQLTPRVGCFRGGFRRNRIEPQGYREELR